MPLELREGTRIGSYTLLRRIGAGGMAEVYLAQQKGPGGFERTVALKFLYTDRSDPQHVQSLVDEAKIAVRLDHPGIVRIFDLGSHEGLLYLVMEFVNGRTLSELWRRQRALERPPTTQVLHEIANQLLDGLHYAHTAHDEHDRPLHVVHRDIKPGNIIVRRTGRLKILDFGIARATLRAQGTMTQGKGTLTYMAPEQLGEGAIGPEADVYSVGVVLYELATGEALFGGDSLGSIISSRRRGISISQLETLQRVQPAWTPVLTRALATSPMERWDTAEAMRAALPGPPGKREEVAAWFASLVPTGAEPGADRPLPSSPTAGGGAAEPLPSSPTAGAGAAVPPPFPNTVAVPPLSAGPQKGATPPALPGSVGATTPAPAAASTPPGTTGGPPHPPSAPPATAPPFPHDVGQAPAELPSLNALALGQGQAAAPPPRRGPIFLLLVAMAAILGIAALLIGRGVQEAPGPDADKAERSDAEASPGAGTDETAPEEATADTTGGGEAGPPAGVEASATPPAPPAETAPPAPTTPPPTRTATPTIPRLEKQLEQVGRDDEAIGDIADAYQAQRGMGARACELYRRALELDPDDGEWRGKVLDCDMRDLTPARLTRLIERHARDDEALGDIGDNLAEQGNRGEACRLYGLALQLDPDDPEWTRKVRECGGAAGGSGKGGPSGRPGK